MQKLLLVTTLLFAIATAGLTARGCRLERQRDVAIVNAEGATASVRLVCHFVAQWLESEPPSDDLLDLSWRCPGWHREGEGEAIVAEKTRRDGPALARRIRDRFARRPIPRCVPTATDDAVRRDGPGRTTREGCRATTVRTSDL